MTVTSTCEGRCAGWSVRICPPRLTITSSIAHEIRRVVSAPQTVIVEMREYTLQAGKVPEYLQLYEREGLEIQREILGQMVGYYSTEVGSTVNEVVHLWAYESFEDRRQRRSRLAAHPGWQAYLNKIRPMLVEQRNRILMPAPFFEPELRR